MVIKKVPIPDLLKQCCSLEVCQVSQIADTFLTASDLLWDDPSEEVALACGEIHLWRAWLDQPASGLGRFSSVLSEDEHTRAGRFHFEKDRRSFIIRRGLLRSILGLYLRVDPAKLRFNYSAFGKPALCFPANASIQFSLSHSVALALFAVTSETTVGVDIEYMRVIEEADEIITRYFSPREAVAWHSLCSSERPQAFLTYWVRKEACLKERGSGIAEAFAQVHAMSATEGLDALSRLPDNIDTKADCFAWNLIPAPDYVAALTCGRSPKAVTNMRTTKAAFASIPTMSVV